MVRDKYAQLVAKKHGDSLATASKEDKRLGVSPERKRGSSRSKNDDDDKVCVYMSCNVSINMHSKEGWSLKHTFS
jgi:hypothetical protein